MFNKFYCWVAYAYRKKLLEQYAIDLHPAPLAIAQ